MARGFDDDACTMLNEESAPVPATFERWTVPHVTLHLRGGSCGGCPSTECSTSTCLPDGGCSTPTILTGQPCDGGTREPGGTCAAGGGGAGRIRVNAGRSCQLDAGVLSPGRVPGGRCP
jgi:hypothetical protein